MSVHNTRHVFKIRMYFWMLQVDDIYHDDSCSGKIIPILLILLKLILNEIISIMCDFNHISWGQGTGIYLVPNFSGPQTTIFLIWGCNTAKVTSCEIALGPWVR